MIDAGRRKIARSRARPQISWSKIRNEAARRMNQIAMSLLYSAGNEKAARIIRRQASHAGVKN
jgi:hypothetical protein